MGEAAGTRGGGGKSHEHSTARASGEGTQQGALEVPNHASSFSGAFHLQPFPGAFMNRKLIGRGVGGWPDPSLFCNESHATLDQSLPRL